MKFNLLFLWTSMTLAVSFAGAEIPIEIEIGDLSRHHSLVTFELPADASPDTAYVLRDADGHAIETQRRTAQPRLLMWVEPQRAANTTYRGTLVPTGALPHTPIHPTDKSITLGPAQNLVYHTAVVNPPKGIKPIYRRSGFIHPLRTPSGVGVTDDFPPDHAHQHGMFMAWTSGHYEGKPADLWNQVKDHGRIEHVETLHAVRGPVFDELSVRLRHIVSRAGKDTPVIDERWHLIVHHRDDLTVIDFTSTQRALTDSKFQVKKYHYGGFAMRGRRDWLGAGAMLNAEGLDRKAGNHAPTRWVDMHGPADGQHAGVAVLSHPTNFRAPQPTRQHPDKPYFCFAPMVTDDFEIGAEPFVSRYRVVAHDGEPDAKLLDALWQDYAQPVRVRVVD